MICEKDRVLPAPALHPALPYPHLPTITQITHLDGVGHIPMFEAPERIADVIVEFVDEHLSVRAARPATG